MDIITWILIISGLLLVLAGIAKFVKAWQVTALIGIVLLIFGFLNVTGSVDLNGLFSQNKGLPLVSPISSPVLTSSQPVSTNSESKNGCSPNAVTSNGLSQAAVLYYNAENATGLGYISASVSANNNGLLVDSGTTNAGGASTAYVTMSSIPNCAKGQLLATVTTGVGVASSRQLYDVAKQQLVSQYDFTDTAAHKYIVQGASGDVLSIEAADYSNAVASSGLTNGSVGSDVTKDANGHLFISGTGTADGNAYFKNTTIGSKGVINFYLRLQVNGSASVFGAYNEPDGVVFSYVLPTSALTKFSPNSLTLASNTAGWSLTKLGACPVDISSNRNSKACWSAPTMKAGTLYEIKGTLTADAGDPVIADNPQIIVDEKDFFRDTDGVAKYQSFSSTGGTNQGVGGSIMNFVVN